MGLASEALSTLVPVNGICSILLSPAIYIVPWVPVCELLILVLSHIWRIYWEWPAPFQQTSGKFHPDWQQFGPRTNDNSLQSLLPASHPALSTFIVQTFSVCVTFTSCQLWLSQWPAAPEAPWTVCLQALPASSLLTCTVLHYHLHAPFTYTTHPVSYLVHTAYTAPSHMRLTGLTHHECPTATHNLSHTHTFTPYIITLVTSESTVPSGPNPCTPPLLPSSSLLLPPGLSALRHHRTVLLLYCTLSWPSFQRWMPPSQFRSTRSWPSWRRSPLPWTSWRTPEGHKEFKPPAVHAAVKSLKCLVGELVGVVGLVTRLVEPVVACGGLCGTLAVEIDQVQQDAKVRLPCDF